MDGFNLYHEIFHVQIFDDSFDNRLRTGSSGHVSSGQTAQIVLIQIRQIEHIDEHGRCSINSGATFQAKSVCFDWETFIDLICDLPLLRCCFDSGTCAKSWAWENVTASVAHGGEYAAHATETMIKWHRQTKPLSLRLTTIKIIR